MNEDQKAEVVASPFERIVSCEDDLFDDTDTADNVIKVPDDEKVFCEDPNYN